MFAATKRESPGNVAWFSFSKADRRVTCFYFYLWDDDFGPAFIKICAYFPYPVKVWVNGHEWAKRQCIKAGIGFTALSNQPNLGGQRRSLTGYQPCKSRGADALYLAAAHRDLRKLKWLRILIKRKLQVGAVACTARGRAQRRAACLVVVQSYARRSQ